MKTTIETISENNGILNGQTLTSTNRGKAIIGFNSWQEMQDFLDEHRDMQLEPVILSRRFGHDSWTCGDRAFKALDPSLDYKNAEFYEYGQFESEDDFFLENIRPFLADAESMDEAEAFIKTGKEMWKTISSLKENERAVYNGFDYIDTIEIESMRYSYDSTAYAIGLINAE